MHLFIHTYCIWIYLDYLDWQDSMLLFGFVSSHGECIGRGEMLIGVIV